MMTVLITLTTAGSDTGPFNLLSNIDGFTVPFESSIAKLDLESGYTSYLVPEGTTVIRVQSTGPLCNNYVDISIEETTTTTTTEAPSTTTTTTTIDCGECWRLQNESGVDDYTVNFTNCSGNPDQIIVLTGQTEFICSQTEPVCDGTCALLSIIQDTGSNCEPECPSLG